MNKSEIEKYHKFHRITMSYGEALKYIDVGWKLISMKRVTLKGIDKEYDECTLEWIKDDNPLEPLK